MSSDLGLRLCQWLLSLAEEPTRPMPQDVFKELWQDLLYPRVRRHGLSPDRYSVGGRSWQEAQCQHHAVHTFVQDRLGGLPRADLVRGMDMALFVKHVKDWVWTEHARQDPLGCKVFTALGRVFRELLSAHSPLVELCSETAEPKDWLDHGVVRGHPTQPGRMPGKDAVVDLIRRGGWTARTATRGESALRAWILDWLPTAPKLWCQGSWPGARARTLRDALIHCVREDAPKVHSMDEDTERAAHNLADPRSSPRSLHSEPMREYVTQRVLTEDGALRPGYARSFYSAVKARLAEQTRRPRRTRVLRLLLWMLDRLQERIQSQIAALPDPLTSAERFEASIAVVAEELEAFRTDWPTETELALDFYRPRMQRGCFPTVDRTQQTEDRSLVRAAFQAQLKEELP